MTTADHPRRVALVSHHALGGSGVMALEWAHLLATRGHDVTLYRAGQSRRDGALPRTPGAPTPVLREVSAPAHPVLDHPSTVSAIASAILDDHAARPFDVVHAHYALPFALLGPILATLPSAPVFVMSLHGTDVTGVGADAAYAPVIRHALRSAAAVTTPGAWLADEARAAGLVAGRVHSLPSFVALDHFVPLPSGVASAVPSGVSPLPSDGASSVLSGVAPAVPSGVAPAVPSGVAPAVPSGVAPAVPSGVAPAVPSGVAPAVPSGIAPAVPSGVSPLPSGVPRRGIVEAFGDDGVPVVVHLSNFRAVKRPGATVDIVAAVRERRRVRLLLIGDGPEQPATVARAQAAFGDDVVALGAVDDPASWLRQTDVLLLPSASESFGLVALEALASGTPVVASDAGGLRDWLDGAAAAALCSVEDPLACANAVLAAIDGGPELRAAARRTAELSGSPERAAVALEHIYACAISPTDSCH